MSYVCDTPIGRLHRVSADGEPAVLLECPGCGVRARLDDDQANGRVSVDHAADGCPGGYHETHDFLAAVEAAGGWKVE
jgi:hypothetical protein